MDSEHADVMDLAAAELAVICCLGPPESRRSAGPKFVWKSPFSKPPPECTTVTLVSRALINVAGWLLRRRKFPGARLAARCKYNLLHHVHSSPQDAQRSSESRYGNVGSMVGDVDACQHVCSCVRGHLATELHKQCIRTCLLADEIRDKHSFERTPQLVPVATEATARCLA